MVTVHVIRTFNTIEEAQAYADQMTTDGRNTTVHIQPEEDGEQSH